MCDVSHFLHGLPGRQDPGFGLGDLFYMELEIYSLRDVERRPVLEIYIIRERIAF